METTTNRSLKQGEVYTFWELLNAHRIEIPVIQRDYAQGRRGSKTAAIRKEFVSKLVQTISSGRLESGLHLDFVYGKLKGAISQEVLLANQQAISQLLHSVKGYARNLSVGVTFGIDANTGAEQSTAREHFVPLDGQQRLTTLFLLHWYICFRLRKKESVLGNFTYKTRDSSDAFCRKLVEQPESLDRTTALLDQEIMDEPWFLSKWRSDPTVMGMLRMLQEIHGQLLGRSETEIQACWENLTVAKSVTFSFLDLEALMQEDNLYVRMNARGKPLSTFENFKSWLTELHPEEGIDPGHWSRKIDGTWTDLFWQERGDGVEIDDARMALFKGLAMYEYACGNRPVNATALPNEDAITKLHHDSFTPNSFYGDHQIFHSGVVERAKTFLTALEEGGAGLLQDILQNEWCNPFIEHSISKLYFGGYSHRNLPDRALGFALYLFVVEKAKRIKDYVDEDKAQVRDWIRVARNLIYNTGLDDAPELPKAILALYKMKEALFCVLESLSTGSLAPPFFKGDQIKEEVRKAELICRNSDWKECLDATDNHWYFYGQVGFLISISAVDGEADLATFKSYSEKAQAMFSKDTLNDGKFLFERALLTKGRYLPWLSSGRRTFCTPKSSDARDRDENWRKVFSSKDGKSYFKAILDDSRPLEAIVDEDQQGLSDWRKYFVEYPECISACGQRLIRQEDGSKRPLIYLLRQSRMSHYHFELYSFVLWQKLKRYVKDNTLPLEFRYGEVRSGGETPTLWIWTTGNAPISISIGVSYYEETFCIQFDSKREIDPKLPNALLETGFTKVEYWYSKDAELDVIFEDLKVLLVLK